MKMRSQHFIQKAVLQLRSRLSVAIALILFLWLLTLSCGSESPIPPSEISSMTTIIQQTDAGQQFKVYVGEGVEVLLQERPSTGYQWQLVEFNGNILMALEPTFIPGSEAVLGSSGTRKFEFVGTAPGTSQILLHLMRPWEEVPIDTFQVSIQVLEK